MNDWQIEDVKAAVYTIVGALVMGTGILIVINW